MADFTQDIYMIIPKTAEVIVFLFCALTIYRRKKEYILNKTYLVSLCGWSIYIIMDAILFPIAHIEPFSFGTISVDAGLASMPMIANILRDIAICAAGVIGSGFLYASIIIRYGEATAKDTRVIILIVAGYLAWAIPTVIFDTIIKIAGRAYTYFHIGNAITIFAQITIFFIAVYELVVIYRKVQDKKEKRRILYFISGSSLIALGIIFFVVVGLLSIQPAYITGPIGHVIWLLAPIAILLGIKK
ncbi:MAG: hypothetical protein HWN66_01550 [Candidatus Helarchaeota archaeon]|nr:hypothetical protein [Candidatus Helarchaeota archaeon]